MDKSAKIYVAGHRGMAGSALVRELTRQGHTNLITRTHAEVDLANQAATEAFFEAEKPAYVILAAARVGGLFDNKEHPAEFIGINLKIQTNVIDAAYRNGAKKFVFLGSSCIYPRIPNRTILETDMLTAPLEKTNEAYAVAKIAGTMMCEAYRTQYGFDAITVMPPNLMGPNDNFDPNKAHVAQGLMVRMRQAELNGEQTFTVWGTGSPKREFMHIDDFANAVVFLMKTDSKDTMFNVGTGEDISILELAQKVKTLVGFTGELVTDPTKPDGTPRKTMDVARLKNLGWQATMTLDEMLEKTYQWYLDNIVNKG